MSDSDEIIQISDRRRRQLTTHSLTREYINDTISNNPVSSNIHNTIRQMIRPRQFYFQDSDDDSNENIADYIDPDNILTNRYLQPSSGLLTNITELPSSDPRTHSTCSICDTNNCNTITKCGHVYCQLCIFKWIVKNASNATCPICRRHITASSCSTIVIIL